MGPSVAPAPPPVLREWRCTCGHLLGRYVPAPGAVWETKCRNSRCRRTVRLECVTGALADTACKSILPTNYRQDGLAPGGETC